MLPIFANTNIQITAQGQRHLGAALGTRSFTEAYVSQKVATWTAEVTVLASVASTRPHVAYCAFTHGMIGRWMYVMRTIPDISPLLKPLEDAIYLKPLLLVIPALQVNASCFLFLVVLVFWVLLTQLMTAQLPDVTSIKSKIHMDRRMTHKEPANAIRTRLSPFLQCAMDFNSEISPFLQHAMDFNSEIGSSSWLIVLPLQDQGFHLHKQESSALWMEVD